MGMIPSESRARSLAERLHAGQVDKAGRPYIEHLERVVGILKARWPDATEAEIEAAWLHDVLEDTCLGWLDLIYKGASTGAAIIVFAVTRDYALTYLAWIRKLAAKGNVSALRVKLADVTDNLAPERIAALGSAGESLRKRYEKARTILEAGLIAAEAMAEGESP